MDRASREGFHRLVAPTRRPVHNTPPQRIQHRQHKFSSPEQIRKTTPPHCSTNQTPSWQAFSCTAQRPKAKRSVLPIASPTITKTISGPSSPPHQHHSGDRRRNHGDRIRRSGRNIDPRHGERKKQQRPGDPIRGHHRQGGQRNSVRRSTRKSRHRGRTVPYPSHALQATNVTSETIPPEVPAKPQTRMGKSDKQTQLAEREKPSSMNQNFIALDIETAKAFPTGEDWREHRPLETRPETPMLREMGYSLRRLSTHKWIVGTAYIMREGDNNTVPWA